MRTGQHSKNDSLEGLKSGIIQSWQSRLLQLDKRNNLLHFNENSKTAVRLECSDLANLYSKICNAGDRGLQMPYCNSLFDSTQSVTTHGDISVRSKDISELQVRLSSMRRRDREWEEEQGTNVLFVAFGLLEWFDDTGTPALAPLILLPADLIQSSPRHPFFLCREPDDPVVNTTLLHWLDKLGYRLPPFSPEEDFNEFIEACEKSLCRNNSWQIHRDAVLSCFAYSKMGMWSDIESLKLSGINHALLKAMVEGSENRNPLVDSQHKTADIDNSTQGGALDVVLSEKDKFLILPADYSQTLAIHYAQLGDHLIIHGPPGTGKSQTIANLIATMLAEGKSVLFVSEKTAALDVVKRRLDNADLGIFCLDLHSERGKGSEVYEQIAEALSKSKVVSRSHFPLARYKALQFNLNEHVRALHENRSSLQLTAFEVHSRLALLADIADPQLSVAAAEFKIASITGENLDLLMSVCSRIANHRIEFDEHTSNFWKELLNDQLSTLGLEDRIEQAANGLREAVNSYRMVSNNLAETLKLPVPETALDIEKLIALANLLQESKWKKFFPQSWITFEDRTRLLRLASQQAQLSDNRVKLQRALRSVPHEDCNDFSIGEVIKQIKIVAESGPIFESAFGKNWLEEITHLDQSQLSEIQSCSDTLKQTCLLTDELKVTISKEVGQSNNSTNGTSDESCTPLFGCSDKWQASFDDVEQSLVRALRQRMVMAQFCSNEHFVTAFEDVDACLCNIKKLRAELKTYHQEVERARHYTGMSFHSWDNESKFFAWLVSTLGRTSSQALLSVSSNTTKNCLTTIRTLITLQNQAFKAENELGRFGNVEILDELDHEVADGLSTKVPPWKRFFNTNYRRNKRIIEHATKHQSISPELFASITNQLTVVRRYREKVAQVTGELDELVGKVELDSENLQQLESDILDLSSLLERDGIDRPTLQKTLCDSMNVSRMINSQIRLAQSRIRTEARLEALRIVLEKISGDGFLKNAYQQFERLHSSLCYAIEPLSSVSKLLPVVTDVYELLEMLRAIHGLRLVEHDYQTGLEYLQIENDSAIAWSAVPSCIEWINRIKDASNHPDPDVLAIIISTEHADLVELLDSILKAREQVLTKIKVLKRVVNWPWIHPYDPTLDEVTTWLSLLETNAHHASAWLHYQMLVKTINGLLGTNVIDHLRKITSDSKAIPLMIEKHFLLRWLEHIVLDTPALRDFDAEQHERLVSAFEDLDRKKLPIESRLEVQERLFENYPSDYAKSCKVGEWSIVVNEVKKQRRRLPIRQLLEMAPRAMRSLKPCFMMSPLAVSQYLPMPVASDEKSLFDILIFDEASQIFPEDAVPAIARCKQIIVVGDEQQLPPTNFFNKAAENVDEEEDDDSDEASVVGSESILSGMKKLLHLGVRECHLNLHYRSRDDSLIRFSNKHFYDNRLLTFPGPFRNSTTTGIRDCYVSNAYFDSGKSRRNLVEAQRVTDLVFEHFAKYGKDRSLGVVALSRAQADLVYDLIIEKRKDNPELNQFFDENLLEPFFVKNLENVQGDERDHIILCIGYSRSSEGKKVANRFGPINITGGERRLNVAVSRARYNLTLVRSLHATDITSNRTGPRLLKQFISYCELQSQLFDQSPEEPNHHERCDFAAVVQKRLETAGHRVRNYSMESGPIDLAIISEDDQRYDLGLLLDGSNYFSAPTARDREWLRKSVLENLGWTIQKTWSADWISNPHLQVKLIEEKLQSIKNSKKLGDYPETLSVETVNPQPVFKPESYAKLFRESIDKDVMFFEPYQETSLAGCIRSGARWDAEAVNDATLSAMLLRLAANEGPIHFDEALERMRIYLNVARIGPKLKDRIASILKQLNKSSSLQVVFDKNRAPKFFAASSDWVKPRRPAPGKSVRKIDRISPQELASGVLVLLGELHSAEYDDCIKEVAKQFGYNRVGPDIYEAIRGTLSELKRERKIAEKGVRLMLVK